MTTDPFGLDQRCSRGAWRQNIVALFAALLFLAEALSPAWVGATSTDLLQEARRAFEQQAYDRSLALVEEVLKDGGTSYDARRLKTRLLIRIGRAEDGLAEYDRLVQHLKREDDGLLREVAIGFIAPLVKDMREQMRGAAYTALKELESDEAVPLFEDGLDDGSGLVRALAVEGLGRRPRGRQSARLQQALGDQAAIVRIAAIKALGRSKDPTTLSRLQQALDDDQPQVRITAASVLAKHGRRDAWERVRQAAAAPNPEERATAVRLLGEIKDARAAPILQDALLDHQPSVRGAAALGLGDLGVAAAVPSLVERINDPIPAVRAAVVFALGQLRAPDSVHALKQNLHDANLPVRAATVAALLQMEVPYEAVSTTVAELAEHHDPTVRSSVARALAKAQHPEAIRMLTRLLDDPLPRPRISAARSLGYAGGPGRIPILKRALRDQDEAVRATAAGALVHILLEQRGKGRGTADPVERGDAAA